MVEIGKFNRLPVIRELNFGLALDGGDLGEILLPQRYVPQEYADEIDVFVYLDSEDRIIATTETPYAQTGQFAYLKVVDIKKDIGAFLDWGLSKDLLVPYREQKVRMLEGYRYIVYVYVDEKSGRIVASSRLDRFLDEHLPDFRPHQKVDLIITSETDIGYNAIINDCYWGVLYQNEVFQPLRRGQKLEGFIKAIRDDDRVDLFLQLPGYSRIGGIARDILTRLEQTEKGYLPLSNSSPPVDIYDVLGISKKNFKKAIGSLYKERLIRIEEDGIYLVEES